MRVCAHSEAGAAYIESLGEDLQHNLENEPVAVSTRGELRLRFRAYSLAGSLLFWCAVAAAWGGILAWRDRNSMNPDGISNFRWQGTGPRDFRLDSGGNPPHPIQRVEIKRLSRVVTPAKK